MDFQWGGSSANSVLSLVDVDFTQTVTILRKIEYGAVKTPYFHAIHSCKMKLTWKLA